MKSVLFAACVLLLSWLTVALAQTGASRMYRGMARRFWGITGATLNDEIAPRSPS